MLWQCFFSNVVLMSLTNRSLDIIKVYFFIILVNYFFVFKSYCLIMKIFTKICCNVYVFRYINRGEVIEEIHYPFQLFHSIFCVLGVQVDLAGFLDIFACFFDEMRCFLRQQVHDGTSVLLFRNSTISARCISKSSKHSLGASGLC